MGNYARLKVTRRLLPDQVLLEGKNHLPEGWALFFSAGDAASENGRAVLQVKVDDAVATAAGRRAVLAPLCDERLLAAFDGLIALVKQTGGNLLRLDPDELEADGDELKTLAGMFAEGDPKRLKKELGGLEGIGRGKKLTLDEPHLVFGSSTGDEPAWLRLPEPPMPEAVRATAAGFFGALSIATPAPTFARNTLSWTWDVVRGPWWISLSSDAYGRFDLLASPERERTATMAMTGMVLTQGAEPTRIAWWASQLAAPGCPLQLPERYVVAWHECPGANALAAQWAPTETERSAFVEGLRARLIDALQAAPTPEAARLTALGDACIRRIGLGDSCLELRSIAATAEVPEHVALRVLREPGDESWMSPKHRELMPPPVQRAEARAFFDAGLPSGLTLTLKHGPALTLFPDRVNPTLPFVYWLNNSAGLRRYALYLLDLPDEAARLAAVERDA